MAVGRIIAVWTFWIIIMAIKPGSVNIDVRFYRIISFKKIKWWIKSLKNASYKALVILFMIVRMN